MSINTSVWTQQHNKSVYSTKTQPVGEKGNRSNSRNGLKQLNGNKNPHNKSQLAVAKQHNISKQSTTSQYSKPSKHTPINQQTFHLKQKLDNQFVTLLKQLQEYYTKLTKHEQIRVQKWIVKIIQNDQTLRWKQNRNNYLKLLLHIVKTNQCLLDPFDKIPDEKDLPYMSQHQFGQRTKPRFDGKSPVFHLHKPQIVKINEPQGDNCSVLISIVNTARTVKDKENIIINENVQQSSKLNNINNDEIKQSQLIEYHRPQLTYSKLNPNSNQKQLPNDNQEINITINNHQGKYLNQNYLQVSSVIPSNLPSNNPSQVKSITPYSHQCNNKSLFNKKEKNLYKNNNINQVSSLQKQRYKHQKYNNHQKYSGRNSIAQSNHLLNKNSLNNSSSSFNLITGKNNNNNKNANPTQQLKVYKQLVLTMGKLLLKHEFSIQKQSQYWQLMRMIYSYQSSLRNSFNNTPKLNKNANKNCQQSNQHTQRVSEKGYFCGDGDIEGFEQFLSRLRQEVTGSKNKADSMMEQTPNQSKDVSSNRLDLNIQHYQIILGQKQKLTNNKHQPKDLHTNHITNKKNQNKNFIYNNDQQTINHITQQSLDFKVQQGAQSQHMLYYQLGQKRKQSFTSNNSKEIIDDINKNSHSHLIIDQQVSHVIHCYSPQNNQLDQKLLSSQHMNNSLMQISDSYREIRNKSCKNNRNKNFHIEEDYHNVYDESEEEHEISFTDKPLIDEDQYQEEGMSENDQESYSQEDNSRQLQSSPQFTDDAYDSQQNDPSQQNFQYEQEDIMYNHKQANLQYHSYPDQQAQNFNM